MSQRRDELIAVDYPAALRRRRGMILAIVALAVVTSIVVSSMLPPVYEARAIFYLLSGVDAPVGRNSLANDDPAVPLASAPMVRAYLRILQEPDFKKVIAEQYDDVNPRDLTAKAIHLQTTSSGLMATYVRNRNPEKAAKIANAFVSYFRQFVQQPIAATSEKSRLLVAGQLDEIAKQLDAAIRSRQNYLEQSNIASLKVELDALAARRDNLILEVRTAEIDIEATQREIGVLETSSMRQRLALLTSSLDANRAKVVGLRDAIRETEYEIGRVSLVTERFDELDAEVDRLSKAKQSLEQAGTSLDLASLEPTDVDLLAETARAPEKKVFPLPWVNAAAAALLGLLGASLYVLFLEGIDLRARARRRRRVTKSGWARELLETLPTSR